MTIEVRIAEILGDVRLVLNAGSNDGVRPGMYGTVVEPREIVDPISGEELGTVNHGILRIRVDEVQPRLSVALSSEFVSDVRLRSKTRKKITTQPYEVDANTVLVERGQLVVLAEAE